MGSIFQKIYQRFIRIRGHPREIARGFALGLFIGFSPTMGVQIVLAVFLAAFLKWNKFAAAIGVQVTNPVTAPFIYGVTYFIGAKLIGLQTPLLPTASVDWNSIVNMIDQAPRIFLALTIGGAIIGVPAAIIGHVACYAAVDGYQKNLKEKLQRQKELLKQKISQRQITKKKRKTRQR